MSDWQPIETAPYGRILGWIPFELGGGHIEIVQKDKDDWWCDDNDDQLTRSPPTHWQPLPEPPK